MEIDILEESDDKVALLQSIKFVDSLVRMSESPEEIWSYVNIARDNALGMVKVELRESGQEIPDALVDEIVGAYFSYVYLGDWPKGQKRYLHTSSEGVIFGFFVTLPINIENQHAAFDPRRFSVITALFITIERSGYSLNLARRLKLLSKVQQELIAMTDEVNSA